MRRILFSLAVLALFTPALLSAQSSADAAAEARMAVAIQHAMSVGVPQSLLESKVAEGRAKGVAAARIAAAVEHRAEVLARVQSAFNARAETVSRSELQAAGDAHERGVDVESITELSARAGEDRAVALTILADLVASGKTPEHALLRVQAALAGGADALVQLSGPPRGNGAVINGTAGAGADVQTTGVGATVRGATAGAARVRIGG